MREKPTSTMLRTTLFRGSTSINGKMDAIMLRITPYIAKSRTADLLSRVIPHLDEARYGLTTEQQHQIADDCSRRIETETRDNRLQMHREVATLYNRLVHLRRVYFLALSINTSPTEEVERLNIHKHLNDLDMARSKFTDKNLIKTVEILTRLKSALDASTVDIDKVREELTALDYMLVTSTKEEEEEEEKKATATEATDPEADATAGMGYGHRY